MLEEIRSTLTNSTVGWSIVTIFIITIITILLAKIVRAAFRFFIKKQGIHIKFIENFLCGCVYFIGILAALEAIPGLSKVMSTILAGSGIIAIVVGLAAQESMGNIISGWFIGLFRPFEVGDRVRLVDHDITGKIEDITLRHTVIKTFTNSRVIVPNSTISSTIIENSHYIDERSSSFIDVYVDYDSDIQLAMSIMADVISSHPLFIDVRTDKEKSLNKPKVNVQVRELGTFGVNLRASIWTANIDDNFEASSDVRLKLIDEFKKNNIKIPTVEHVSLNK